MRKADKYPIIAIDVDGVMADFMGQYIAIYNVLHPDDPKNVSEIEDYDFFKYLQYKEVLWNTPGFFEYLPVKEGVQEVFKKLDRKYNVIIVTACPASAHAQRIRWFEKNFPYFDTSKIIFAEDKTTVNFDILIDDCPDNVQAVGGVNGSEALLFSSTYCKSLDGFSSISNWKELSNWVDEWIKRREETLPF